MTFTVAIMIKEQFVMAELLEHLYNIHSVNK